MAGARRCSTCGRDFQPRPGHPGDEFCFRCRPGRRKRRATSKKVQRLYREIAKATRPGPPSGDSRADDAPPRLSLVPRRAVYRFGCLDAAARGAEVER
jgi:hypothetical protein